MANVLITCPGCGFSKEVPSEAIPRNTVKVNCPKCKSSFPLLASAPPAQEARPAPPPPSPAPPASREPVPPGGARTPAQPAPADTPRRPYAVDLSQLDDLDSIDVEIEDEDTGPGPAAGAKPVQGPAYRQTPAPGPARKPVPAGGRLSGIGEMFDSAWGIYKGRAVTLVVLTLLVGVFLVAGIVVGAGGAALLASVSYIAAGVFALAGITAGYAAMFWAFAALMTAVVDDELGVRDALSLGRFRMWSMFWLMLLTSFMVIGGYFFFIIPGILFSVWFFFGMYLLVDQGGRGVSALMASRDYVRGNGWGVFGRLLLLWGLSTASGMVPFVGPVLSLLVTPFLLICGFLIYADLKAIKGEAEFTYSTGEKARLVATGAFGYVLIPLLITAFVVSYATKLGISPKDFLALQGINFRLPSLGGISGITGGLFEKDPEVRQAYADYRKALMSGDTDALKKLVVKDKAKDLEGAAAAMVLELAKALSPENVNIVDSSVDGDRATLTLQADTDGGTMNGTATLLFEDGSWKLDEENWDMTVGPPAIKLAGGSGAPDVEPLGGEYLSSPGMYGMGMAQPFVRSQSDPPRELATLTGHEDEVTALAFAPYGGHLVSASYGDYTVRLWDAANSAQLASYKMENRPTGMAMTPDGATVILVDAYQNLTFLPVNMDGFGDATTVQGGVGSSPQVAVSPNGRLAATASFDKLVTIWDLQTRTKIRSISTPEPMRAVAFSPAGDMLAASDSTNKFTLWDLRAGEGRTYVISKVAGQSDVATLAISPDSKRLATGHMDSSVSIWDLKTQKEEHNFYVTDASTWKALFSPDSALLATAHQNGDVYLWDAATAAMKATLKGHAGAPKSMAFNPEGSLLATGGEDRAIKLWGYDLASGGGSMDQGQWGMQGGTATTAPAAGTPPSADLVSVKFGPGLADASISVYIYSINYKGMVRLNGQDFYEIKGEKDMNYNYSGGSRDLRYGNNVFDVEYKALPDDPWMTELRIKVYRYDFDSGKESVYAEWKLDDKGGRKSFVIEFKE